MFIFHLVFLLFVATLQNPKKTMAFYVEFDDEIIQVLDIEEPEVPFVDMPQTPFEALRALVISHQIEEAVQIAFRPGDVIGLNEGLLALLTPFMPDSEDDVTCSDALCLLPFLCDILFDDTVNFEVTDCVLRALQGMVRLGVIVVDHVFDYHVVPRFMELLHDCLDDCAVLLDIIAELFAMTRPGVAQQLAPVFVISATLLLQGDVVARGFDRVLILCHDKQPVIFREVSSS